MDRVVATYLLETSHPLERAAAVIAGEQSSGTFVAVPGETAALKERFGARIERLNPLGTVDTPSLPGCRPPGDRSAKIVRAELVLSFPFENFGANLPTLAATVLGNLFELSDHSGLKLLELEVPDAFRDRYPGPQFGIDGTRRLAGVADRPLIGTIVKPSVGLTPEATAALVRELCAADIDFIKDDELLADPPHSPLDRRVAAVMAVIDDHAQRTGKKVMYAVNASDEVDAMRRHHDTIVAHGGTCIMVSLNHVGLAGVSALRRHSQLPIHGHRNGWGMLTRHPALGIAFPAYATLWRLAGADHLHVNGLRNKFWEPDDSVATSIAALQRPLFADAPYTAMPVIASGQWAGQAPDTFTRAGTTDLLYVCGGGLIAHPGGPGAGVRSIRQAWEAAVQEIPLETYARSHRELREAIEAFGGR
jgi:ribulose-bisphosphate carboxylase large chain